MRSFYGENKRKSYFEGWYLKHQSETESVAFIPAYHVDRSGRRSASLQIITETQSYHCDFPIEAFHACSGHFCVRLGNSLFAERGCRLNLSTDSLSVRGVLRYGPLLPPAPDIMGPFRFVPFLQCRHSVLSLTHQVTGTLHINGRKYTFPSGTGYIEGDRGTSFPKRYLWTQCCWMDKTPCSLMLSVADVPFYGTRFTGCICSIYFHGKEYRLATYHGVKLLRVGERSVFLQQGDAFLEAELVDGSGQPLRAPEHGGMDRTVYESTLCRMHYRFSVHRTVLFDFVSDNASFEYSSSEKIQ